MIVKNVAQIKSGIMINIDVNVEIQKKMMYAKKKYIWNPARCSCLNGKYLGSINDD